MGETVTIIFDSQVLEETIMMLQRLIEESGNNYLIYILNQLIAVKNNIVNGKCMLSEAMIQRYFDFGGFAIKNFDEDDELGLRLRDLYSGLYDYNKFSD